MNIIEILLIVCVVELLGGGLGLLVLDEKLKSARADLVVSEANEKTCAATNADWVSQNTQRNAQIEENQRLAALALMTAQNLAVTANRAAGGIAQTANALNAAKSTKATDCDRARDYVNQFYATKGVKP
jgi:hypothetical protein